MKHYEHRVATYRKVYDHKVIDTREGWAKKGFVVIQRRKGEVMYTNGFLGRTAEYFYDTDVKENRAAADRYLERLRGGRNARRRKLARTKKDRAHAAEVRRLKEDAYRAALEAEKRGCWRGYLAPKPRILLFDCETGGLDCVDNDMLSLSYQLIEVQRIGREDGECSTGLRMRTGSPKKRSTSTASPASDWPSWGRPTGERRSSPSRKPLPRPG